MLKYKRINKNLKSLLIGTTHNSEICKDFVNFVISNEKFDKHLIELNKNSFNFINKNNLRSSEFFSVIEKTEQKSIFLIDVTIKQEIQKYQTDLNLNNKFYINNEMYNLHKTFYYKFIKTLPKEFNINSLIVNKIHIKHREKYMLDICKKHITNSKCLIITGINHFDFLFNNLK